MPDQSPDAALTRSLPARVTPLVLSAALLLGANGLSMTVIAVRGRVEGLTDAMIGLLGSAYYAGLLLGVLVTPFLIRRVGHIRVFAALASVSAVVMMVLLLIPAGPLWLAARFASGIAFCGTAMVVESWLNALASNAGRGRVLSVYRIVDLAAVTGAQFLLPLYGAGGYEILVLIALLFSAGLVPVALAREGNPPVHVKRKLNFIQIWRISPVAVVGCLTIGLTNGAFRSIGPLYAEGVGLGVDAVAFFISLWIVAGAIFQYPLGWASDRVDRRLVLMLATIGAGLSCLLVAGTTDRTIIFTGIFLFGGFALPLYSLSAAHANDHAEPGQYVELAAGLTLSFALGAVIGPFAASLVIDMFGPRAFFIYTSALHFALVAFIALRIAARRSVPQARRQPFVWLLRYSPMIYRLARNGAGQANAGKREKEPRK